MFAFVEAHQTLRINHKLPESRCAKLAFMLCLHFLELVAVRSKMSFNFRLRISFESHIYRSLKIMNILFSGYVDRIFTSKKELEGKYY